MDKVYLETSFVGYLTSRPSRDLLVAAHQQITHEWWEKRRSDFELFISRIVIDESSAGDEDAAQERLTLLEQLPVLQLSAEAIELAKAFVAEGVFPERASEDALHVAVAAVNGMDFLLTWNCRHIANAETVRATDAVCRANGYEMPEICTPEELMGE